MRIAARILFVVLMLALWFFTQKLIAKRGFKDEGIQDKIHDWTAHWNDFLRGNPLWARRLLISSSLGIDLIGVYLLLSAIFGASITPFLGLVIIFALRQLSQYLTALPAPQGIIWYDPGVPSLLVTYSVANDLFFSGHTALAVYGALQLWESGSCVLAGIGVALALFEAAVVLVLRAHWTMDVFAGAVTALFVDQIADRVGPNIDAFFAQFF